MKLRPAKRLCPAQPFPRGCEQRKTKAPSRKMEQRTADKRELGQAVGTQAGASSRRQLCGVVTHWEKKAPLTRAGGGKGTEWVQRP